MIFTDNKTEKMKGKTYLLSYRNKKQEWGREICI